MNQQAQDLLMGAPSEVPPKQLRELHIRVARRRRRGDAGLHIRRSALRPEVSLRRGKRKGCFWHNLTIALCISIGTGVPWLMAIFTRIKLPAS